MASWLLNFTSKLRRGSRQDAEPPIREELYSAERLEQYAATLAAEHKIAEKPQRVSLLLPRLEDNGRKLIAAYQALVESIREEHTISPAAEWLVDNFHIVEEQVREIREDLPKSYYHELPKLAEGDFRNYPRIYALAVALIAHTDSHLDTETLRRFINAYQKVSPLSIGELWAVAISLRIALVENLRRLATRIVSSREEREEADTLADKLIEAAKREPKDLVSLLSSRLTSRRLIGRAFVVQLTQRLREQDPAVMPVVEWLDKQLAKHGVTIEQMVHEEHHRQAAAQVTVGNIITSMRLLSTLDWKDFFETVSLIDPELARDPAGVYSRMDFSTRDRYRHVVERISKGTKKNEPEIARSALRLAELAGKSGEDPAHKHVGYFLVGDGLSRLETEVSYRLRLGERLVRNIQRHATRFYLGSVLLFTMALLAAISVGLVSARATTAMLVVGLVLSLAPAAELAVSVANWIIMHGFEPRLLPAIDSSKGIPAEGKTIVVVPAILNDIPTVLELINKLEITHLANQDENLFFALLGDCVDATAAEETGDREILETVKAGIEQLNSQYGSPEKPRFHLFYRRRQWCETEQKWIGWERKRGKLHEFNRLARGATDTSFIIATATSDFLRDIRYVITLDADTQLPRDAARKLIGKAIHPLNQPRLDERSGRVTSGYSILQPRVSISLESASRSLFAQIFSGNTGIDPYTTAASDVYQDLFGEGIYTGKGLYEIDSFERALHDRVPVSALLSHDLFESIYARAALVTDVEFLDDYPTYYDTYAMRQHRWTRGDWQIAGWILRYVKGGNTERRRNDIPTISRWKIFDNLRRSLLAPGIILFMLASWTVLPGNPLWWTVFALLVLAFPVYSHVTTGLLIHQRGIPWTSHFWTVWGDMRTNTAQLALSVVFLAHQAYLMGDAIVRTVYRKLVSKRHLLEWVTAQQVEKSTRHDAAGFAQFMWPAQVIAFAALIAAAASRGSLPFALPFIVAWAFSPVIAFYVSRQRTVRLVQFSARDIRAARIVARRTWRFFETFVGDEDHWLPPDNFQEDPRPLVAHRTSPTNIGLLLLSTVAAYDFGYLGLAESLERIELTLVSLEKLQKFRGHFFNWHDTRTLAPLWPHYVSVVDSGNLAGCLIALRQTCLELPDDPIFDVRTIAGFADTLEAAVQESKQLGSERRRTDAITIKELQDEITACTNLLARGSPDNLQGWASLMQAVSERATAIEDIVAALSHEHGQEEFAELSWWAASLLRATRNYTRDLHLLTPWAAVTTDGLEGFVAGKAELRDSWASIITGLRQVPSLARLLEVCDSALVQLAALRGLIEETSDAESPARARALTELKALTGAIEQAAETGKVGSSRVDLQACKLEYSIVSPK